MIAKRHIFTFIAHLAFFMAYAHRFNFSVAIVGMVAETSPATNRVSNTNLECPHRNMSLLTNTSFVSRSGEFTWNEKEQGLLLSGFFHGYILTLLLGGVLISRFSAKSVFAVGILVSSVLTLVTPIAATTHFYALYASRFMIGCSQGASLPAVTAVLGRWAPVGEKSRMGAIIYSGMETGSVGALIFGGLLYSHFDWPTIFYVFGGAGVVLFFAWMICVSNSPEEHSSISTEEKFYILHSQDEESLGRKESMSSQVPWKCIFLSLPVWTISIAAFSHNWVYYLAATDIPSYFKTVLNMHMSVNGLVSALPFAFSFITQNIGGLAADFLISKGLNVTKTRKIVTAIGFCPSALCLCIVGYMACNDQSMSITLIVLIVGIMNFSYSGYGVNQLDLSPRFAGIIWSITAFLANLSGGITPIVTGYITNGHPTRYYYRIVFMIAAGVCVFGVATFCLFGSGEEQEWSRTNKENGYHGTTVEDDENNENRRLLR